MTNSACKAAKRHSSYRFLIFVHTHWRVSNFEKSILPIYYSATCRLRRIMAAASEAGIEHELVHRIKELCANFQYRQAHELCKQLEPSSVHQELLDMLEERIQKAEETLREVDGTSDGWIHGLDYFGISTYYKVSSDRGILTVKLEGIMEDLPLFEQVSVLYETDLYKSWVPFCDESIKIYTIGHAELLAYLNISLPMVIARDTVIHAYACDLLEEEGKLILIGKSVHEKMDEFKEKYNKFADNTFKETPLKPITWFHNRLNVLDFKAIMEPITPTSVKTTIIATMEPNLVLPQFLINFIIKNIAGLFLYFFTNQVKKIVNINPAGPPCQYKDKVQKNPAFYCDWIVPKLKHFMEIKGWEYKQSSLLPAV